MPWPAKPQKFNAKDALIQLDPNDVVKHKKKMLMEPSTKMPDKWLHPEKYTAPHGLWKKIK